MFMEMPTEYCPGPSPEEHGNKKAEQTAGSGVGLRGLQAWQLLRKLWVGSTSDRWKESVTVEKPSISPNPVRLPGQKIFKTERYTSKSVSQSTTSEDGSFSMMVPVFH